MKRTLVIAALFVCLAAALAAAEEDKGRPDLSLAGGKQGNIAFPHALHQKTLPDCEVCHKTYPAKQGVIEKMVADGSLKGQQVMRECIACHRQRKKESLSFGPLTCKDCHHKGE